VQVDEYSERTPKPSLVSVSLVIVRKQQGPPATEGLYNKIIVRFALDAINPPTIAKSAMVVKINVVFFMSIMFLIRNGPTLLKGFQVPFNVQCSSSLIK
jgi:hypothetical protein